MKVLFYMPLENLDLLDLDGTTVGAQFEHLAETCNEARSWLHKNKAAIMAHGKESFVEMAKTSSDPIMRQFVGMKFSYEACCAINGYDDFEYEHNLSDAPNAIATAVPAEGFVHGEFDKQGVIRFADQLHRNATETSIRLLKEADMFGAKLTDKTLMALKGEAAQKVTAAIGILQNKPSKALDTAFVTPDDSNDEDVRMRCWPHKNELQDVYDNPEFYAIASVDFCE